MRRIVGEFARFHEALAAAQEDHPVHPDSLAEGSDNRTPTPPQSAGDVLGSPDLEEC
jgi:hypothetical protein